MEPDKRNSVTSDIGGVKEIKPILPRKNYKNIVKINKALVKRLVDATGVDPDLVFNLVQFAKCMTREEKEDEIDETIFSGVLFKYFNITDKKMISSMFSVIKTPYCRTATVESVSKMFCIFFTDNIDIKIEFIFNVYDINNDGSLESAEVSRWVEEEANYYIEEDMDTLDPRRGLYGVASDLLAVNNQDGLTIEAFKAKVKNHPTFIEILGQCMPREDITKRFVENIKGKSLIDIKKTYGNMSQDVLNNPPTKKKPGLYPVILELP